MRSGEALGPDAFRARLAERDPEIVARLKTGDRQRHVRAWEVLQRRAGSSARLAAKARDTAPWRFATVLLAPDRGLAARAGSRPASTPCWAAARWPRSARSSTAARSALPGLKAHGAPELRHFRGEMSLPDARRVGIDHTRQYAKRQMTWFGQQMTPDLMVDSAPIRTWARLRILTKIDG